MLQEGAGAVLLEGDPQLLLGVHHDGAVPGHGFAQGLSRDEQEAHRVFFGGNRDPIAVAEEDQGAVGEQGIALQVEVVGPLGLVGEGFPLLAEAAASFDDIGEGRVSRRDGVGPGTPAGMRTSRYEGSMTTSRTGPRTSPASPQITLTWAPPGKTAVGIWALFTSR